MSEVLGLNNKDLLIYKRLLIIRQSVVSQIGCDLSIPRQTALSVLNKLQKLGLVHVSSRSGVRLFIADPSDIKKAILKKHEDLHRAGFDAEEIIPELEKDQRRNYKKPIIKYYDGKFGLRNLFQSMLTYYQSPGSIKEFRGYGLNTYRNASVRTYLSHFIKKRKKLGVKTRLLIGKGPEDFTGGKSDELNIQTRHMDTDPQNAGVYILEDKVYMFSFSDNAGVVVENKAIAKFLKLAFDDHWSREG